MLNRRKFLKTLVATAAGMRYAWGHGASPGAMPWRPLGKTGEQTTLIGVGGFHVGWTSERDAQELLEIAIEEGIHFFDNAFGYGRGSAEERFGRYLIPRYRDKIYLMSKTGARTYEAAMEHLETSLRRMGVDQLDAWQLHALRSPEDVDERIENGVLRAVEEALSKGRIRHAGFTGHASAAAHRHMLERTKGSGLFSMVQMPVNVVDAFSEDSFIHTVFPLALEQGLAVLGMKSLADGRFFAEKRTGDRLVWTTDAPAVPDVLSVETAFRFTCSLPVSVLIVGAENAALLREKADMARRFEAMTEAERIGLIDLAAQSGIDPGTEYYKRR